MHEDLQHPDLTFPSIPVGEKETPLDLKRLLYKGGASIRVDRADQAIRDGLVGPPQADRTDLVRLMHECVAGDLAGGGSVATARKQICEISLFFSWADTIGAPLRISELERTYIGWSEHLLERTKIAKDLNQNSAYGKAQIVGRVIDFVLGRAKPIVRATRLPCPQQGKTPQGAKSDKQNLEATFAFGRLLQDVCDATSLSVVWTARQITIPLQQGGQIDLNRFGRGLLPESKRHPSSIRESNRLATAYETDRSLNHRFRRELVNLRIQAELLMFLGQTGMNLAQATKVPLRRFSYSSDIDSYKVREYKPRRKGEVLFEIFSEYRGHFERYLEWRRELFDDTDGRLFPLFRKNEAREDVKTRFRYIKAVCEKSGVTWTAPSLLRGTRVNWLLRRSGDPDVTAEMAQHHKRTLLEVYEIPSQQRAVSEIMRFHLHNDPALSSQALLLAVAPGECDGTPVTSASKPRAAPEADCLRPSGCLWCEHHRDIDSLDYVWSLASFRHLKILELSQIFPTMKESKSISPVEYAIQRLSEKLCWFRESNTKRREWIEESLMRVEEGDYHDQWSYLIEAIEGASI